MSILHIVVTTAGQQVGGGGQRWCLSLHTSLGRVLSYFVITIALRHDAAVTQGDRLSRSHRVPRVFSGSLVGAWRVFVWCLTGVWRLADWYLADFWQAFGGGLVVFWQGRVFGVPVRRPQQRLGWWSKVVSQPAHVAGPCAGVLRRNNRAASWHGRHSR